MVFLRVLFFTGCFVAVIGLRCHVVDNSAVLHCGDLKHMKCSSLQYSPYCERLIGDTSNTNGLCTCEKWCLADSDCSGGCRAGFNPVCREAYSGSQEKVCLCGHNTPVG